MDKKLFSPDFFNSHCFWSLFDTLDCQPWRILKGPHRNPDAESPTTTQMGGKLLRILFLCTGNSCRSQMAEGWAKKLKGDVIESYSAGTEAQGLNLNAVKVMAEAGVDISGHKSKTVADLETKEFDYVITVCSDADQNCPIFPGKAVKVHHGFDDPPRLAKNAKSEEEALWHYRRVRDEIREFVMTLPESLPKLRRAAR